MMTTVSPVSFSGANRSAKVPGLSGNRLITWLRKNDFNLVEADGGFRLSMPFKPPVLIRSGKREEISLNLMGQVAKAIGLSLKDAKEAVLEDRILTPA